MAEVISLTYLKPEQPLPELLSGSTVKFSDMKTLLSYLFKKGSKEENINHATIIVLDSREIASNSKLDALEFKDKMLLFKFFFYHLNVVIINQQTLANKETLMEINGAISKINELIKSRISRVESWTGTGNMTDETLYNFDRDLRFEINDIVATMMHTINLNLNVSSDMTTHLIGLKNLIVNEINFEELLTDHSPEHLAKLCHYVGHWAFPAHEMTNDDLVYCLYLMINYALQQVTFTTCRIPNKNELLGFIFLVRDSYKSDNPFHNFRHAVDVLQACFHFLIRLKTLPVFLQLEVDPSSDPLLYVQGKKKPLKLIELTAMDKNIPESNLLKPMESFGLLIAALGHDIGHPGVTNAFLIKYSSPAASIYNDRSVLELFHSSIFINRVLAIYWPNLLAASIDEECKTSFKEVIILSILATDMAEHFEYINKLKKFNYKTSDNVNKIKLISSLLIKCADISNVTRPLRVSSQWALALSREFDEIILLEKKINQQLAPRTTLSPVYPAIPTTLDEILKLNPNLHNSQIFFINTFADKLFSNIVELLPELQFTTDIIAENKAFWLARSS